MDLPTYKVEMVSYPMRTVYFIVETLS